MTDSYLQYQIHTLRVVLHDVRQSNEARMLASICIRDLRSTLTL